MTGCENSMEGSNCEVSTPASADQVDSLFDCMAVAERRRLVERLAERTDPVERDTLVQWLTERTDAKQTSEDTVETALVHVHLPKLEAASVVTVDPGDESVGHGKHFPAAVALLDVL